MAHQIQARRDTAANWAAANPVLAQGEVGYDTTNDIFKIGDGTTAWNTLPSVVSDPSLKWLRNVSPIQHSNVPLELVTTTQTMGDGTLYLNKVWIGDTRPITGVGWIQSTNGSFTADNNNKVGLYSSAGTTLTLVASSTNDGTLFQSGTSGRQKAFSSPYTPSAVGTYFIAHLANWSSVTTTPVTAARTAITTSAVRAWSDSSLQGGTVLSQTDLPATVALSSVTNATANAWVGLY